MNTSLTSLLTDFVKARKAVPEGKLAYFRERQRNRLYDLVVTSFLEREKVDHLKKADIARILNKKPEQITRWLANPGNWTLDTVSDLMLAISGSELGFSRVDLNQLSRRNSTQMDVLSEFGKNKYYFSVQNMPASTSNSAPIKQVIHEKKQIRELIDA